METLEWPRWVAFTAFVVLLGLQIWQRTSQVAARWYQARAAAESAKTLAWRYAAGAPPFDPPPADVDSAFVQRLKDVAEELGSVALPASSAGEQITAEMRALRASPLPARIATYVSGRLADQVAWYSDRSRQFGSAGQRWDFAFYLIAVLAAVSAFFYAVNLEIEPAAGLAATALGGVLAWTNARNHQTLASSYSVAALELDLASALARTWPTRSTGGPSSTTRSPRSRASTACGWLRARAAGDQGVARARVSR